MEQAVYNMDENSGVEMRQSAPGRVETLLHGSCPKCHHWHDKVRIWLSQDPDFHNDIRCQNEHCQHKMFGLGGNSSHFSLLSRETIQPRNQGPHIPVHCTNEFTIYAALPAAAASALAAPTPTIANSLDPQFPLVASQELRSETRSITREIELDPQTTTQSETLTRPRHAEFGANLRTFQTAPDHPPHARTDFERSGRLRNKRFRKLRSTARRILASFGVEIFIRRIPRNVEPMASRMPQEAPPPPRTELSRVASRHSAISRRPPSAKPPVYTSRALPGNLEEPPVPSASEHSRSETLKGTNTGEARNSGTQTPQEPDFTGMATSNEPQRSDQVSSVNDTSPSDKGTSTHRCGCPLEPAAREAWIKERRRNLTVEEEERNYCDCTPSCACYKFHTYEASSKEAEAPSLASRSDGPTESEAHTTRSSFSRASSSIFLSHMGWATRSEPASRHDSLMSNSVHSHHPHDGHAPVRSSTGSTQYTSSSDSSNPSSGSRGVRPPRRTSTLITNMTMSTADEGDMAPLAESQEPPFPHSPTRNSVINEAIHQNSLVNGRSTPPATDNDEDIDITPTATRNRQDWPRL